MEEIRNKLAIRFQQEIVKWLDNSEDEEIESLSLRLVDIAESEFKQIENEK